MLIKVEDIIRYLSFVKSRPGMFFQPQDSYDVATAHAWGFLTAAYFDCMRGVHTPPFRALKKGMYPETNTLPKQHTSPFRARYVDCNYLSYNGNGKK